MPDEDIPVLEEMGVAKVFTPGAPTTEITGWVAEHFAARTPPCLTANVEHDVEPLTATPRRRGSAAAPR